MRKASAFIIFISLISLWVPQLAAEEPAVFTLEAPDHQVQVGEEFSITVFLEPGDKPIDAFIIHNLTWTDDCFDIISVEPGWWDWLFDGGNIGEDYIKWTQAGQQTKAVEKQVACVFNCIAEKEGNSEITIDMAQAISGGPEVPVALDSTTLIVQSTGPEDQPPPDDDGSDGGGGYPPPPVEDPEDEPDEEEPEPEQRDETIITEGEFTFTSEQEPEEEPTVDETEEPVNNTASSEQDQEEEDEEDLPLPLPEILVAVGGLIGAILIIMFVIKRKKKPSREEPEGEEIVLGK